jgi:hypothetical protein
MKCNFCLLHPSTPLENENNEALPPLGNFVWKFYQGEEEGLGPYNFCACSNRK